MAKKKAYESKAVTKSIKFTSRASIKVDENFYTVEATEERMLPDVPDIDIAEEKRLLWDAVNTEVDMQIDDIWDEYEKARKKQSTWRTK